MLQLMWHMHAMPMSAEMAYSLMLSSISYDREISWTLSLSSRLVAGLQLNQSKFAWSSTTCIERHLSLLKAREYMWDVPVS